jgi:hypothetical protein
LPAEYTKSNRVVVGKQSRALGFFSEKSSWEERVGVFVVDVALCFARRRGERGDFD